MKQPKSDSVIVRIRIVVLDPPPDVWFRLQSGRDRLLTPAIDQPDRKVFECELRLGPPRKDGRPIFLGDCAQGPPDDRFIYINSGESAGQPDSCWNRRAKVKLGSITAAQVEEARKRPGAVLEAQFAGAGRDGGPSCATVPLFGGGWNIVEAK